MEIVSSYMKNDTINFPSVSTIELSFCKESYSYLPNSKLDDAIQMAQI